MRKILKILFLLIIFISIIGGIFLFIYLDRQQYKIQSNQEVVENEDTILEKKENIPEVKQVFVDIKGAVKIPGVYEIESDKKVIDVINLAGGFTDNADTSMINLAKKVTNEMVVIIYTKEEVKEATKPNQIIKYVDKECICPQIKNDACINTSKNDKNNSSESTNKTNEFETTNNSENQIININTADVAELQKLSGVGESKALAIIAYREEHGGFSDISQLKEVSGIGEALYEKIKDHITI